MCQERLRLDIRGNFFMERVVQPRAEAESPFLERFNRCVDVALGDMMALAVLELYDLRGLFQPE